MQVIDAVVKVGIMTSEKVDFILNGIFSTETESVVCGAQSAEISIDGKSVKWGNRCAPSIVFYPTDSIADNFELQGVTIGVDFHWQQKENQRFAGALQLLANNGAIVVINIVNAERYLDSVISSEMNSNASLELLRAHAVISRSWLFRQIENKHENQSGNVSPTEPTLKWYDHDDHDLFDVCADDHCQRYQGLSRVNAKAASAVADTKGKVLVYDGEICDARFSKCCGGMTEEYRYCWDDRDVEYLRAQRDDLTRQTAPDLTDQEAASRWILSSPSAYCNNPAPRILKQVLNDYDQRTNDFFRWEVTYSTDELTKLVARKSGLKLGAITDIIPLSRGRSGRIWRLRLIGTEDEAIIGKELEIRRVLSATHLYSSAFVVQKNPDGFTFIGAGWGHGVGLCQIGAAVMADRGFSYTEILRHYYPGTEIKELY